MSVGHVITRILTASLDQASVTACGVKMIGKHIETNVDNFAMVPSTRDSSVSHGSVRVPLNEYFV